MELNTRNVNTAFKSLVEIFQNDGAPIVRNETRNGPVLHIDEPVLITYERPLERVLFNEARDANPFFHLYEALWMLAGRNDVTPLAYYASNMANYSDDGKTLNGAYGYRWRNCGGSRTMNPEDFPDIKAQKVDQLDILVAHLKSDLTSRRAVLQIWQVGNDLLKIGANPDRSGNFYNPDLKFPPSKDVCCNLSVIFSIKSEPERQVDQSAGGTVTFKGRKYLDMTVTNRSNDMIWGCLGANVVHFSFLQEYMAARLGVKVGRYHHFTNNLHVYESNWKPEEWLAEYDRMKGNRPYDRYVAEGGIQLMKMVSLVADPERFEREIPKFVEHHSGKLGAADLEGTWTEPFLQTVAGPMLCAFACHKGGDYHGALTLCDQIEAADWRQAATAWIRRRMVKKGVK